MKIHVKLIPGSKKESIEDMGTDLLGNRTYRIKLSAKPIDGQANKALIDFLSEYLKIPRRHINILSGHTSREKLLEIQNFEG